MGTRKAKATDKGKRGAAPGPRLWRRLLRVVLVSGLVLAGLGGLALHGVTVYLEATLPAVMSIEDYRAEATQMSRLFGADGTEIGSFFEERRTLVDGHRLPRHVREAAVAAEDGDFYSHEGLDYFGIARAMLVNLRDGRFSQGASTISQQVARSFYLSQEKTLVRKAKEALFARRLERQLTKDEILEIYLNQIYFGHGRWGIGEASRHYLGKSAESLAPHEAALLMALVPAPERLNPLDAPEEAMRRRDAILGRMVKRGFLTDREGRSQRLAPLALAPREGAKRLSPWFRDAVRRRLEAVLGRDQLRTGGLRIYTTLRPEAQRAADRAVGEALGAEPDAPQTAVVVLDARSREVVALVGGRDFAASSFNRALQARRQAGSTFKPLVYGAGLWRGTFGANTTFPNEVVTYRGAKGPWLPRNADGVHDGRQTTVEDALITSLNVVAVQALRATGIATLTDFARRAGVESPIPADLTAALGSAEVVPLEMANAYATLADRGRAGRPVFIRRVEDPQGRVLYAEEAGLRQAIPPSVTGLLTQLLEGVVKDGTGKQAAIAGVRVAGKTGTTNGRKDAWFVGYTVVPEGAARGPLVGAVWIGHDDGSPVPGTGGSYAAPLWARVMDGTLGARSRTAEETRALPGWPAPGRAQP